MESEDWQELNEYERLVVSSLIDAQMEQPDFDRNNLNELEPSPYTMSQDINGTNYWASIQIIPLDATELDEVIMVMFFLTPSHEIDQVERELSNTMFTKKV